MANSTGSSGNKSTTNNKKNLKQKKKKNPVVKAFKIFFITLLCIIVIGSVAGLGVGLAMIKTAPSLDVNGTILNLDQPSVLYDDKNEIMDTVITTQKRTVVHMDSIPQNLSHAFISIEDERFYQHNGIDIKRIAGAMLINIKNKVLKENGGIQGASTITQELIKQRMFLTDSLQNRISWKRKVQEAYLATELEKNLTKDQILEAYMNTIYLGGQANGVQAASKQYFNKDVKDLNLIECAFIAGLPQSPSAYYPFSSYAQKNPSIYLNRTKTVLQKMHDNNYISDADYSNALTDLDNNKLAFNQGSNSSTYTYQWFSSAAMEQVKTDLKAQYNYTDEQVNNLLSDGGLKIYTTMDRNLEDATKKVLDNDSSYGFISTKDRRGLVEPQAAASIVDYRTGEVKALIGGRGTQPPGSYNRAYGASFHQAVGSSIKPLTVYAPAIENRVVTAGTVVDDSPLSSSISSKYSGYQPHNDDNSYGGPTTISDAITRSVNVVAVKVENELGVTTGAAYGEKFGLTLNSEDKRPTAMAAIALGQLNYGSNSTTMASAYGTFGNSGLYIPPRLYTKVVDKNGNNILETSASPKKIISPQTAYIMYDLLKGPVVGQGGTAHAANYGDMPVAGKTGTSTNNRNVWFCGLTPYYSGAVWIGNDDQSESPARSYTSAKVWGLIMQEATKNLPVKDLQRPEGITDLNNQLFLDGTEPTIDSTNTTEKNSQDTSKDVNTPVPENKQNQNTTNTTNSTNTTDQSKDNNTNSNGANNNTETIPVQKPNGSNTKETTPTSGSNTTGNATTPSKTDQGKQNTSDDKTNNSNNTDNKSNNTNTSSNSGNASNNKTNSNAK
ncbi:PBP1A family penicillin-binding protein [Clostridium sp.]|jgi:penicillin-binding protein 1A|uniref:transglycosylase domain-containing protein n=1 Tax=Clostridium sp. TaxID=1506 RepID=UPI0025846B21|nr:PBP1A family penicillin-binding protein [Clostridium sp.]MDF2504185.1 pbpA1 [Clostridium sp.]